MLLSGMAKYDRLTLALELSYVQIEIVTPHLPVPQKGKKKVMHWKGEQEFPAHGTEAMAKLCHGEYVFNSLLGF